MESYGNSGAKDCGEIMWVDLHQCGRVRSGLINDSEKSRRGHDMFRRPKSIGIRAKGRIIGGFRLAVVATATLLLFALLTIGESKACQGNDSTPAVIALDAILMPVSVDADPAIVSSAPIVENLRCCGAASHHANGAPCSSGHCTACWTTIPIAGSLVVATRDSTAYPLVGNTNPLFTNPISLLRPPRIPA